MFVKSELSIIQSSIDDYIKKVQSQIHDEAISEEEKLSLEQTFIQAMAINNKLLNVVPDAAVDGPPITAISPVMVVDDSVVERELNVNLLWELGYSHVVAAKEGEEALALLKQYASKRNPFRLVLCDWNMPKMSGLDFLKFVRKDKKLWQTPVYLVTANHDKSHIITALKAGVSGYIVKPVSLQGIKDKIKRYLPEDA